MTDEIVTPENTKLIAEWMGYSSIVIAKDCNPYKVMKISQDSADKLFKRDEYNPITNADQRSEIEEKLLKLGWSPQWLVDIYVLKKWNTLGIITAATLPLAIYKAALYEAKKWAAKTKNI